jgi:hypothetical protein
MNHASNPGDILIEKISKFYALKKIILTMSLSERERESGCYIKYTIKINGFCFKQKYSDEKFLREKFKRERES